MRDRRSETRMLCADVVEARWRDESGRLRRIEALLEDISPRGACLQLDAAIRPGTPVALVCPGEKLNGLVRYCVFREIGYFLGVEFKAGTRWSRRQFEPRHLLDLEQLLKGPAR